MHFQFVVNRGVFKGLLIVPPPSPSLPLKCSAKLTTRWVDRCEWSGHFSLTVGWQATWPAVIVRWCPDAVLLTLCRLSPSPATRVRTATGHARARRTYEISPRSSWRPGSPWWACSTGPTRARRRPAWTSAKDDRYWTDLLARRRHRACVFWTKVAFHVWQPYSGDRSCVTLWPSRLYRAWLVASRRGVLLTVQYTRLIY